MEKTTKQKCLEMWKWLAYNPGKSKRDYKVYLICDSRMNEFRACWACHIVDADCDICPIKFPEGSCLRDNSCYQIWDNEDDKMHLIGECNKERSKRAALEMVELIETTWKE